MMQPDDIPEAECMWLLNEVAKTMRPHGQVDCVVRSLTSLAQTSDHVETHLLDFFAGSLSLIGATHTHRRGFTDACNTSNLVRFLWDYMTRANTPRFRAFFGTERTSQLHMFTSHPTFAFSIVFDSPKLIRQGIVHPDGCRLVIYTLVVPSGDTSVQWSHRKRQRCATAIDHVARHIDALSPFDGVSLKAFTKWVANGIFAAGATGMTLYADSSARKQMLQMLSTPPHSELKIAAEDDVWTISKRLEAKGEGQGDAVGKGSKKQKRRRKRHDAANLVQRAALRYLEGRRKLHCSAKCITRQLRGFVRQLQERKAASFIQWRARFCIHMGRWSVDRHDRRLAIHLASREATTQERITQSIHIDMTFDTMMEQVAREIATEAFMFRARDDVEANAAFDALLTDVCRSVAHETLSTVHARLTRVSCEFGAIATVHVAFQGQTYQMHVTKTSEFYQRRHECGLVNLLISASSAELQSIFAPRQQLD